MHEDEAMTGMRRSLVAQRASAAGKIVITSGTVLGVVGGTLVAVATPAGAADYTVTSTADTLDPGTLRSALAQAQDGDTITFDLPAGSTITLTLGQLELPPALEAQAGVDIELVNPTGSDGLTIEAAPYSRAFDFYFYPATPGTVTISGLTITGGNVEGDGGGINAWNTNLELTDVVLDDNDATGDGGGLSVYNGSLLMQSSTASGNTAGDGGGVSAEQGEAQGDLGDVTIRNSTLSGNLADGSGGGAAIYGADYVVVDGSSTRITGNSALFGGGVAVGYGYSVAVEQAVFTGNTAGVIGGGLLVGYSYTLDVDGATISSGNAASLGGGAAVFGVYGPAEISDSRITGNLAQGLDVGKYLGAGILMGRNNGLEVLDTTISGNISNGTGGGVAIFNYVGIVADALGAEVGGDAGAVQAADAQYGLVDFERTTISGNDALDGDGGGIWIGPNDRDVQLLNSTVSGNTAPSGAGGGVYAGYAGFGGKYVSLDHSTIVDNTAAYAGGVAAGGQRRLAAAAYGPYGSSYVRADHTIIAGNVGTEYANDVGGAIEARYSLVEDTSSGYIVDIEGNIFNDDPELLELADYGGPTETHLPEPGSPVIDAGDDAIEDAPDLDQRQLDRIEGSRIDIGSVEANDLVTVTVAATTPTAVEGGTPGVFTFTRTGPTTSALTIGYSVTGTAGPEDFTPLGTVTFLAGQSSVTKQVVATDDGVEEPDETVIVTVSDGTGYSVAPPISATVTIIDPGEELTLCENAPEDGFTDVPDTNVHEAAVDCLKFLGITEGGPQGLPDTQYGPALDVTRGQMASFLARLITRAGVELPEGADDAFDDDDGTTHEENINKLFEAGIVEGFEDGTYREGDPVRRDQMASFLLRTYDYISAQTLPPGDDAFTDDDGNVHEAAIDALQEAGVIEGTATPGIYNPSGDVRRDQMGSFLIRLAELLYGQGEFPLEAPPAA